MMTMVSLTDCCRLLAIDPKTFRRWLAVAQLSVQSHPLDARIKGITRDHLLLVATAHRRTLPDLPGDHLLQTPARTTEEPPPPALDSIELVKVLTALPAQIAALQQHLAVLTHHLHQLQREPAAGIPAEPVKVVPKPVRASRETAVDASQPTSRPTDRRRQHAHVLPVVEYDAHGGYVVICPQQGILSLEPDSPEWFVWLGTLPAFRFLGRDGRLTAHRGYQCSPGLSWRAHRQIRNHTYNHRLGQTEGVTIAALEQAAAALQAHLK